MPRRRKPIIKFYDRIVLTYPRTVLFCLMLVIAVLAWFAKDFRIDASPDTLVNESDKEIQYAWKIYNRYGSQDFLVVAYTPEKELLSDEVLSDIESLKKELQSLERVESVATVLDVPLLESPPVSVREMASGELPTLRSGRVDREMARKELKTSPIYRNLLVSPDLETTALQINFRDTPHFGRLVRQRIELEQKAEKQGLSPSEEAEYRSVKDEVERLRRKYNAQRDADIRKIRRIMASYRDGAELHLGGVSMIAHDLIRFIKNDLKVFGLGVFGLLVIVLGAVFRRPRWVVLPMLCCAFSGIAMAGLLGLFGWKVTVISSNFISLQLIMTMAIAIHLVVRYREHLCQQPDDDHRHLVLETMHFKITPIFYAALTTCAGFGSLFFADIKPVSTFGWMMVGGIIVSFLFTVLFFPSTLVLLRKTDPPPVCGGSMTLTSVLGRLTQNRGRLILLFSILILIVSVLGVSRLEVENSFVNYFKESTEIYQGMKLIDRKLGGTTPLDVVVRLGDSGEEKKEQVDAGPDSAAMDEFGAFSEFEEEPEDDKYWFTQYKMNKVLEIHNYLAELPETGKVLSLGTLMKVARELNKGEDLDSFELSLVFNEIPREYRKQLVKPFVSVEHDEVRLMVRVEDTNPSLRRNELINRIRSDLTGRFGYDKDAVHLTGLLVLYNNVLQSLFDSQILTLGIVLLALMLMFLVLFRSFKVAVIAVFPNLFAVCVVLGAMGWAGIPLDIMTITIAAISVGIAVDDTIHYIHRFRKEIRLDWDYTAAMHRSHGSIGYAMYYTSIAIILGFSILALSNFIPTIIFGVMTGLAMLIALLSALTLLPYLLIVFKPWRPDRRLAGGKAGKRP